MLGDLVTFRSRGSMSGLTPYLAAGLVQLDAPDHQRRRQELNPAFTGSAVGALSSQISAVIERCLPTGPFDAVAWSAALMREILAATFLGGQVAPRLLADFLRPLDRALPAPFIRRPVLFHRMNQVLARRIAQAPAGTLAAAFRGLPNGTEEMRVALSAAYDTTAHTLAWLLGHVAGNRSSWPPNTGSRSSTRCSGSTRPAGSEAGGARPRPNSTASASAAGPSSCTARTSPSATRGCGPIR